MRRSDHVHSSSEPVQGVKIPETALPRSKARQVFDKGAHMMQAVHKRSEDHLDYYVDLRKWLEPDETIIDATASVVSCSAVVTRLEFADKGLAVWVASGGNGRHTIHCALETSLGKHKLFAFVVLTRGCEIAVVSVEDITVLTARPDTTEGTPAPGQPFASLRPYQAVFAKTEIGQSSEPAVFELRNLGDRPFAITSIATTGDFDFLSTAPETVRAGETFGVTVRFKPTVAGARAGTLRVQTSAQTRTIQLSGQGAEPALRPIRNERLRTLGNQFVRADGTPVRLMSVNWFGAEGTNYVPHGLWARSWRSIIDQIKAMGFNCIRLPFSGDFLAPGRMPVPSAIDSTLNADLTGLSALEIFDKIIAYCSEKAIYVVLDHHRRSAGDGADGTPISGTYTADDWIASWQEMADRYGDNPTVVGADIHNEPHSLTWAAWATLAEQCGNAIHEVAQDWIIFVEGVGSYNGVSHWWGGQLAGVADRPVVLGLPNRLAYSPHEYGQSVAAQPWLAREGEPVPAGWPDNLYPVFRNAWGFIFEQNIAPIWVGEFGGHFGVDSTGQPTMPHKVYEARWGQNLCKYLNGDYNGDGSKELPGGKRGMSFAYWGFPPNSGDTGGLVQDDWLTEQSVKLAIINPLLTS